MIKKNILITGSKNTGKSTLVQKILQQFSASYAGFQTIPFEIFEAGPTYLMRDLITKKQTPISKCVGKRIVGIPITFSTFGKRCLENSITSKHLFVVMDELGRFERTSYDFIDMVNKVLSSEKIVIAVLKAESIDYLSLIKDRPDCYLYNLDDSLFDEVYQDIISKLNIILQREEKNEKD